MTAMQKQAIEMIKSMSDDKIYYVVNILEGIKGLTGSVQEPEITKSQRAYENLQHYRKEGVLERDYKKELEMCRILKLCADKKITGYMAAHSIPNMFYVLRKDRKER